MTKLKNIPEKDLVDRWDSLMPEYLEDAKQLKEILNRMDKKRKELLLIREELKERNIEVDGGQE